MGILANSSFFMINGLIIILSCQLAGELIARGLGLPIPGTIVGMLLLLLGLVFFQTCRTQVQPAVKVLIQYLTLLFFPIGAGLILEWHTFAQHGMAIIVALAVGTVISIVAVSLLLHHLLAHKSND